MKITFATILLLASSAFGQLTIEQLQAKAKEIKAKDFIVAYDKYKDQSHILTKPYNLVGSWEGAGQIMAGSAAQSSTILMVSAELLLKGTQLETTPQSVNLIFSSMSKNWVFLNGDRNVYVLYDDKRLELKPVEHREDVRNGTLTNDTPIQEQLAYEISLADLKAVAAAKDVSLKIGDRPRKFKPELLERFANFVKLVTLRTRKTSTNASRPKSLSSAAS